MTEGKGGGEREVRRYAIEEPDDQMSANLCYRHELTVTRAIRIKMRKGDIEREREGGRKDIK